MMKTILAAVSGAAISVVLLLSCSDDAPGDADAAACECPATEPPIPGRLMMTRGIDSNVTQIGGSAAAQCPSGSKLVSGGCYQVSNGSTADLAIRTVGPTANETWFCIWDNNTPAVTDAVVYAEALCLMPP